MFSNFPHKVLYLNLEVVHELCNGLRGRGVALHKSFDKSFYVMLVYNTQMSILTFNCAQIVMQGYKG